MIYIGNHVSVAKGFLAMGNEEISLGGSTFAFFTRNPRGGNAKEPEPEDVAALRDLLQKQEFGPLVAHAPYTMNLCSSKASVLEFSNRVLREDLKKMEMLPGNYFNFHPGSHLGQGFEAAAAMIAGALDVVIKPEQSTVVLLETMAGKGTEVGGKLEELREIRERTAVPEKVGVCLDTCHVWDAGYDIVRDLDGVLDAFDRVIGLNHLYAVHLNDSKNDCGSHKDRHEKLGQGRIGLEALLRVVRHPALQGRPFILETPNDSEGYAEEIAVVKEAMTP